MANPKCSICEDTGFYHKDGAMYECQCRIKERLVAYLGIYATAKFHQQIQVSSLKGKSLLLDRCSQHQFNSFVKTFLLAEQGKLTHKTLSAGEVMEHYLSKETTGFQALRPYDILIITMVMDPPNRRYDQVIGGLIQQRINIGKATWVFANKGVDSSEFLRMYGLEVTTMLKQLLTRVNNLDKM